MSGADSPSARLRAKLGLVMPAVLAHTGRLWQHPAPREVYMEWLRDLHGMIRATVPLMLAALDQCLCAPDDEVSEPLSAYFARHIREEHGHDTWVAEDYAACGEEGTDLEEMLPSGVVASLVGAQYYWIRHVHPVALLGHIAVMEGYPPAPGLSSALARKTGLPDDAFRALARHASLDLRHRDELLRTIDSLPLTPRHEALIGSSALHTARTLFDVMEDTVGRVDRRIGSTAEEERC